MAARARAVGAMAALVAAAAAAATLLGCGTAGSAEPFRADVRFVDAGGERVALYERGRGRPLVLATGTGSTMAEWDPALLGPPVDQRIDSDPDRPTPPC